MQVNSFIFLEFVSQPVHDHLIKVVTAQVSITIGTLYFKYAITQLEYGNIKRTATKVKHGNLRVFMLLIKAVSQCSGGRLINNPANIQARNLTGFLSSLALSIIKVCRYGNNCLAYFIS